MTQDQIAAVAKGLTGAQRRAVLWLDTDVWKRMDKAAPRAVSFWCLAKVMEGDSRECVATVYSLVDVAAPEMEGGKWAPHTFRLTPLGIAVRDFLREGVGNG